MLIANYRGLRHNDPDALKLARRWSTHAFAFLLDPVHDVDQMLLLLRWSGRRAQDIDRV